MRSLLLLMSLAAGSASSSSCDPVRFQHPLSEPTKATADPRLAGTWAGRIGDAECTLRFASRPDGLTDVAMIAVSPGDGAVQLAFAGFPTTVGGQTFINLRAKHYTSAFDNKYDLDAAYQLVRLDFDAAGAFTLYSVIQDSIAPDLASKSLHASGKAKTQLVTDTSAALSAWLATPAAAKAFKVSGKFAPAKLDFGPAPDPRP